MLTFEQWAQIADAYIPLLALASLALIARGAYHSGRKAAVPPLASLTASAAQVYLLMAVDNYVEIYPAFGLDYSTHTAVAWVFMIQLLRSNSNYFNPLMTSLILYAALMVYQGYHTFADILMTSALVVPLLLPLQSWVKGLVARKLR